MPHQRETEASPLPVPSPPSPPVTPTLPAIPPARPGPPRVVSEGLPDGEIVLTVDDGTCAGCVAAYVDFARRTGMPLTFCPNGKLGTWDASAAVLRPLVESGQVQIANHTWSHPDLRGLSDARVQEEIERNEEWIQRLFGVTARPWFRPPFGAHSDRVDAIAGDLGYTSVLLWSGTLGDSAAISSDTLLELAERYFRSGAVVLGHANHPTVLPLLDQLRALLVERQLRPVTLDKMFGTSRRRG